LHAPSNVVAPQGPPTPTSPTSLPIPPASVSASSNSILSSPSVSTASFVTPASSPSLATSSSGWPYGDRERDAASALLGLGVINAAATATATAAPQISRHEPGQVQQGPLPEASPRVPVSESAVLGLQYPSAAVP